MLAIALVCIRKKRAIIIISNQQDLNIHTEAKVVSGYAFVCICKYTCIRTNTHVGCCTEIILFIEYRPFFSPLLQFILLFIIDERILLAPRSCTFVPNKLPIWNFKDYLLNAFIKYYLSTQYVCMYTHPYTHKCIYTFEQDGFIIWTQKKIFEFTAFLVDKYCLLAFSLSDKRPLVFSLNSEKDWF